LAILACLLLPETRNQELSALDVTPQSVPADPKPEKTASADISK
jgi:hypothetical protein